ncbi:AAA family ATPase [Vibrio sp. A1-b2]|nr:MULTISPECIES: AAA family ATPase [Vibrio]MCF7361909.1 AAA family ATPase [Vibrio sp. A1-b2]
MDLNNLFKSTSNNSELKGQGLPDLVISNDSVLLASINDLYALEGFIEPKVQSLLQKKGNQIPSGLNFPHVILDMRDMDKDTIIDKISEIIVGLDVSSTLVVLSKLDSIKLQKQISALGAVYVLWEPDLSGLLAALSVDHTGIKLGGDITRKAKRILVLGTKGGIGVSTFSSVLSYSLANQAHLKTLLVDYDSAARNSDVLLGIRNFEIKPSSGVVNRSDIDRAVANNYQHQLNDRLAYMALEKLRVDSAGHSSALFELSSTLSSEYNFIIDSVPCDAYNEIHERIQSGLYHRIFILCEPSVSSLRCYNVFKKQVEPQQVEVVFSLTRLAKEYVMTLQNAKERIHQKSAVDVLYESSLDSILIKQGMEQLRSLKYMKPIAQVVELLTKKNISVKSQFSWLRFRK